MKDKRVFTRRFDSSITVVACVAGTNAHDFAAAGSLTVEEDMTLIGFEFIGKLGADLEQNTTGYGNIGAELSQSGEFNVSGSLAVLTPYFAKGIENKAEHLAVMYPADAGITLREGDSLYIHLHDTIYAATLGEYFTPHAYCTVYLLRGISAGAK